MTIFYVDALRGSDANSGTSEDQAKATYAGARAASAVGNDKILLKRGQKHFLTSEGSARNGSNRTSRFEVGAYGTGSRPIVAPAWQPASNTSLWWVLSGAQFITIRDIVFDAMLVDTLTSCLQITITSASDITDVEFVNCDFARSKLGSGVTGSHQSGITLAAFNAKGLLLDKCRAYGNGVHGFANVGGADALLRRCVSFNNGLTNGGHGFSSQGRGRTTLTSGWVLVAGSVYSRAITTPVFGVWSNHATYKVLQENISTPTNPAVGEFGQDATTLYVNFGVTPNGISSVISQIRQVITYLECEAYGNNAFDPYLYVEGTGFQADDYSTEVNFIRCKSHDNAGVGFTFNNSAKCGVFGSIAKNNGRKGLSILNSSGVSIHNVTLLKNNLGGTRYPTGAAIAPDPYEVSAFLSPRVSIKNVAIDGRTLASAIMFDDARSVAGSTADKVRVSGCDAVFSGSGGAPAGADRTLSALGLNSDGSLAAGSTLIGAGVHLGYGYLKRSLDGAQRPNPPSIGCCDVVKAFTAA